METPTEKRVLIIDETLREGMQYRGLVFNLDQRLELMAYQENLKVDICQAGYPSAHPLEAKIVSRLAAHAKSRGYGLRTAALGRANLKDAKIILDTGVDDIHFHLNIPRNLKPGELPAYLETFKGVMARVRGERPDSKTSVAVLDMGKTSLDLLSALVTHLSDLGVKIISLPDTSGIMAPHQVEARIKTLVPRAQNALLSIHCHNDMGMASANTLAGVRAGAGVMEASALGIGERNGIADLFTCAALVDLPPHRRPRLKIDKKEVFKQYYTKLSTMAQAQTGRPLLHYATPAFGRGLGTHVAGTHAGQGFGLVKEEAFYLNLLCGNKMVAAVLSANQIHHDPKALKEITQAVKEKSLRKGRSITPKELAVLAQKMEHK